MLHKRKGPPPIRSGPFVFFSDVFHRGEGTSVTELLQVDACPVDTPVGNDTLCLS
jgi:hypothetical protein